MDYTITMPVCLSCVAGSHAHFLPPLESFILNLITVSWSVGVVDYLRSSRTAYTLPPLYLDLLRLLAGSPTPTIPTLPTVPPYGFTHLGFHLCCYLHPLLPHLLAGLRLCSLPLTYTVFRTTTGCYTSSYCYPLRSGFLPSVTRYVYYTPQFLVAVTRIPAIPAHSCAYYRSLTQSYTTCRVLDFTSAWSDYLSPASWCYSTLRCLVVRIRFLQFSLYAGYLAGFTPAALATLPHVPVMPHLLPPPASSSFLPPFYCLPPAWITHFLVHTAFTSWPPASPHLRSPHFSSYWISTSHGWFLDFRAAYIRTSPATCLRSWISFGLGWLLRTRHLSLPTVLTLCLPHTSLRVLPLLGHTSPRACPFVHTASTPHARLFSLPAFPLLPGLFGLVAAGCVRFLPVGPHGSTPRADLHHIPPRSPGSRICRRHTPAHRMYRHRDSVYTRCRILVLYTPT